MAESKNGDRYRKISVRTSNDPWFRGLPDDSHRLLWMHIMSCTEGRDEGLFKLDVRQASKVVVGGDVELMLGHFQETRKVCFDNSFDVLFIPNALKYFSPKNDNEAKGAVNRIRALHNHWTVRLFLGAAMRFNHKVTAPLRDYCNEFEQLQPVPETVARLFPELVEAVDPLFPPYSPKPVDSNPKPVFQ